jgi:hypothetical protein
MVGMTGGTRPLAIEGGKTRSWIALGRKAKRGAGATTFGRWCYGGATGFCKLGCAVKRKKERVEKKGFFTFLKRGFNQKFKLKFELNPQKIDDPAFMQQ